MPNYRLKCQNSRCGCDVVRVYSADAFEKRLALPQGHICQRCNAPRMKYMVSNLDVKDRQFDGWGYHDGLNMTFRGPNHYRSYLKENGLIEVGNDPFPVQKSTADTRAWTDETLRGVANEIGGLEDGVARMLKDLDQQPADIGADSES